MDAGNRPSKVPFNVEEPSAMSKRPAVVPVKEQHRFDVDALVDYLEHHVDGFVGPVELSQYEGGQSNPTYRVSTPGREYVLRRKPPGKLLPSAHAVDREYRVITALAPTNVPVPKTYVLCEDNTIIGTAFYLMEDVPGRILRDPLLPELLPAERLTLYENMVDVLARLHGVDYQAIGLNDFGRAGSYFTRQIHRWTKQYRASETEHYTAMEKLIDWLPKNIPEGDETTLVHGDYRLDNLVLHPVRPAVVGVLDWELSTLGHPLADLAYLCQRYHLGPQAFDGFLGMDLDEIGIPSERTIIEAYCERTDRVGISNWTFYMAFSIFRIAAILQGIMGRVLDGTASAGDAAERGALAGIVAEHGWNVVEGG